MTQFHSSDLDHASDPSPPEHHENGSEPRSPNSGAPDSSPSPFQVEPKSMSNGKWSFWQSIAGLLLLAAIGGGVWYFTASRQGTGGPPPGMAQQPQGIPVELGTAESSVVAVTSEFVGTLEALQSLSLKPEVPGQIQQIYVQEGDRVEQGTPILRISGEEREADLNQAMASVRASQAAQESEQRELEALRADRDALLAEVELQRRDYDRIAMLVEEGAFEEQRLDQIQRDLDRAVADVAAIDRRIDAAIARVNEAAELLRQSQARVQAEQSRVQDTELFAPFSGTIGRIPVEVGDYVNIGESLLTLVENQVLELVLSIPLEQAPDVRPGLAVQLTDSQGTPLGTGQIDFIAPQVDTASQTVTVKAVFDNRGGRLLDQQFVRASIVWDERTDSVVIPTSAVVFRGQDRFVYVVEGDSPPMASLRPIQVGLIRDDQAEIVDGLDAGTTFVISGIQKLFDGAPLMPLDQNAAAQEGE